MNFQITSRTGASLSASIARVTSSGKRLAVRSGKQVVGIVPLADLELLNEMDRRDVRALRSAERRARSKGEKPTAWRQARTTHPVTADFIDRRLSDS